MDQQILLDWKDRIIDIALKAGKLLNSYSNKPLNILTKATEVDLITEADKASEALIISELKQSFPDHEILSEESGNHGGVSPFLWVIDPLDGTTNFAHRYPVYAISIGLLFNNEPILGVVYNPVSDELFAGVKGGGCTLNGKRIGVSKTKDIQKSLLATGFAYDRRETNDTNYSEFCYFTHLTQGVRREGSASLDLAYVAAGRLDGYWERGIKIWDIAAGVVLVKEAGGIITDYDNSPLDLKSGRILATNGYMHSAISQDLTKLRAEMFSKQK